MKELNNFQKNKDFWVKLFKIIQINKLDGGTSEEFISVLSKENLYKKQKTFQNYNALLTSLRNLSIIENKNKKNVFTMIFKKYLNNVISLEELFFYMSWSRMMNKNNLNIILNPLQTIMSIFSSGGDFDSWLLEHAYVQTDVSMILDVLDSTANNLFDVQSKTLTNEGEKFSVWFNENYVPLWNNKIKSVSHKQDIFNVVNDDELFKLFLVAREKFNFKGFDLDGLFYNIKKELPFLQPDSPITLQGSFLNKLNFALEEGVDSLSIKYIKDKTYVSDLFEHNLDKDTYHYFFNSLLFFGLINSKPKLSRTDLVLKIDRNGCNSLEEYLNSRTKHEFKNIFQNFDKLTNNLSKIIYSSYLYEKNELKVSNLERYQNVFDAITTSLKINDKFKMAIDPVIAKKREKNLTNFKTKYKNQIEDIDNEEKYKEILRSKLIRKYRRQFKEKLLTDFNAMTKVIQNYNSPTFEKGNEFPFPEGAHIVSVKELIIQDRIEEIANHENGLLLDPNTHTLFDKEKLSLVDGEIIRNKKSIFKIYDQFLTPKRQVYIKEYNELNKK